MSSEPRSSLKVNPGNKPLLKLRVFAATQSIPLILSIAQVLYRCICVLLLILASYQPFTMYVVVTC